MGRVGKEEGRGSRVAWTEIHLALTSLCGEEDHDDVDDDHDDYAVGDYDDNDMVGWWQWKGWIGVDVDDV